MVFVSETDAATGGNRAAEELKKTVVSMQEMCFDKLYLHVFATEQHWARLPIANLQLAPCPIRLAQFLGRIRPKIFVALRRTPGW